MSGSSYYNFSEKDLDFNDPGKLSTALQNIQLGKPQTHGRVLLDKANEKRLYPEFNTHTPPDITPNTTILAVLGIDPREAAPNRDGWFLSDFFAFYHMFRGPTKNQIWMHGLDLEELVATHGRYLHGNPFKGRKIVTRQWNSGAGDASQRSASRQDW